MDLNIYFQLQQPESGDLKSSLSIKKTIYTNTITLEFLMGESNLQN